MPQQELGGKLHTVQAGLYDQHHVPAALSPSSQEKLRAVCPSRRIPYQEFNGLCNIAFSTVEVTPRVMNYNDSEAFEGIT
jgi:hypothetical protein